MGDSLTAGNGIFATNLLHVTVENRGVVWSIGGQYDWRKYLTLPNILKEFNPNLYGYAIKDGISTDRTSRFDVAELAAMSTTIIVFGCFRLFESTQTYIHKKVWFRVVLYIRVRFLSLLFRVALKGSKFDWLNEIEI